MLYEHQRELCKCSWTSIDLTKKIVRKENDSKYPAEHICKSKASFSNRTER